MQSTTTTARQAMGCGFESPPASSVPVTPLLLLAAKPPAGHEGIYPTTCPGYTTKLPEVSEAARARFHHEHGALVAFCDGEHPTELLVQGVETLSLAVSECTDWCIENPKEAR